MTKIIKDIIHADGIDISVYSEDLKNDYISLTDIARKREGEYPGYVIQNWLGIKVQFHLLDYGNQFITRILIISNSRQLKMKRG